MILGANIMKTNKIDLAYDKIRLKLAEKQLNKQVVEIRFVKIALAVVFIYSLVATILLKAI